MSAAPVQVGRRAAEPLDVTLLELVCAVSEVAETEQEVVATVLSLLGSRQVRLCGNFRGVPIEDLA